MSGSAPEMSPSAHLNPRDGDAVRRRGLDPVSRWVLHVDLDQFLAAVEMLRHPELRGRAVEVGGDGDPTKRGVVSTASYEARELGVGSGTPLRTAARRIQDAVFLPVDREHHETVSAEVMSALGSDGTVVEVLGWDEAFLVRREVSTLARRVAAEITDGGLVAVRVVVKVRYVPFTTVTHSRTLAEPTVGADVIEHGGAGGLRTVPARPRGAPSRRARRARTVSSDARQTAPRPLSRTTPSTPTNRQR